MRNAPESSTGFELEHTKYYANNPHWSFRWYLKLRGYRDVTGMTEDEFRRIASDPRVTLVVRKMRIEDPDDVLRIEGLVR